ncbi:hypothetical protein E2C01_097377 [Portunus trituberculatus]|uniref:Uncharacterized protein n=1 Tax=Portunus trituberculatus TaxID=210409 RepID=A0A5B7JV10_PORTR|nr:hypothetical protein [Portunus trituberculatus]
MVYHLIGYCMFLRRESCRGSREAVRGEVRRWGLVIGVSCRDADDV